MVVCLHTILYMLDWLFSRKSTCSVCITKLLQVCRQKQHEEEQLENETEAKVVVKHLKCMVIGDSCSLEGCEGAVGGLTPYHQSPNCTQKKYIFHKDLLGFKYST